ncbi:S1C family serine protease [Rhizobium leucaenae]|uniref:S1C family serine protease n=1 Tax=Rhizobium leucaenae TaxID=29450 RepID=UPI0007EE7498|nr:serine protease [Rhizobium leucaenae]
MRYYRYAAVFVLALTALLFSGITYVTTPAQTAAPRTISEASVVKVTEKDGHGSGVNIGNGYVITAGHVADGNAKAKLKTSDGREMDADVLWVNKEYDIALLRAVGLPTVGSSLDCRTAKAGEEIQAAGNPMDLEFVSSFGRIAGDVRELGPWRQVLITDITIVMGQSGGPVFEADGRVVGITVGVASATLPGGIIGATPSLTGFGMVVPSSTVCMLMGRA